MKRFNERWWECVRLARQAPERPWLPAPPIGWRVAAPGAAAGRSLGEAGEWEAWWRWYGVRGLAVGMVILLACGALVVRDLRETPSLRPGVEDAVAEVLWRL